MEAHCFHLREKISYSDKVKYQFDFVSWDFEESLPASRVKTGKGKTFFC